MEEVKNQEIKIKAQQDADKPPDSDDSGAEDEDELAGMSRAIVLCIFYVSYVLVSFPFMGVESRGCTAPSFGSCAAPYAYPLFFFGISAASYACPLFFFACWMFFSWAVDVSASMNHRLSPHLKLTT